MSGIELEGETPFIAPERLSESPVHQPGTALRWTTANVDEGLPGTVSPLTWSMYFPPTESTMRDCWVDMGVMEASHRPIPTNVDERFFSVAYGHAIANVDHMGQMAARIPGGSAASLEAQLFGAVQGGGLPEPTGLAKVRRWPHVAVKLPRVMRRAMLRHPELAVEINAWWSRCAFETDMDASSAVSELVSARRRFEEVLTTHMVLSMAAQGLMEQVSNLAVRAGDSSLAGEVIKTDGGTAEFELVRDMWALAEGSTTLDTFVRRHGYHGPREGLVDSVVWRENPDAISELVAAYQARGHDEHVDALVLRRSREQRDALQRMMSGLGPARRVVARRLVRFAAHVPEWRETGRANILQCVDVARAMSRIVGRRFTETGALADPDDVRFLSIDEIEQIQSGAIEQRTVMALVDARRADHEVFDRIALPHLFHGPPEPSVAPATSSDRLVGGAVVEGIGVSAGIVVGTVHIVEDLDSDFPMDLPDVVMVCRVTDPSWASLFPLAVAVVTDTGSQMSHAAIVCRELGLPCVANTRTGTAQLSNGDRVRVDGGAGLVTVL